MVTDTDVLANDVNIDENGTAITENADFVMNALDDLTGGGALISLRSRGVSARPFTTLDEMEAAAQERYRETELRLQAELEQVARGTRNQDVVGVERNVRLVPAIAPAPAVEEKHVANLAIIASGVAVGVRALPRYFAQEALRTEHAIH